MTTPPTVAGAATVNVAERKGRGRPKGAPAKDHPEIPVSEFVIEDIDADHRGYLRRQRIERSKQQMAVDRMIMDTYKVWLSAGSPTHWPDMPVRGWVISKALAEEAQILLSKGAVLHNKKLVNGKVQEKPLPELPLPEGKVRIPFCVVARKSAITGVPGSEDEDSAE